MSGSEESWTAVKEGKTPRTPARRGIRRWLTERLARYLSEPVAHYELRGRNDFDRLKTSIGKGDILLVEGDQRVSAVIKYLTQSSWSHAALYIGDELLREDEGLKQRTLEAFGDQAEHLMVEAVFEGVIVSPLVKYIDFNVRLCRPHRLRQDHNKIILDEAIDAVGLRYDLRNIIDLARHLILISILGRRYRERALRLGSGASSQVICTSLLGRLFHQVGFPVLPSVTYPEEQELVDEPTRRTLWSLVSRRSRPAYSGLYRQRHPSLLTPRDFDLSPYFQIVKFNVVPERAFDYSRIEWDRDPATDEVA